MMSKVFYAGPLCSFIYTSEYGSIESTVREQEDKIMDKHVSPFQMSINWIDAFNKEKRVEDAAKDLLAALQEPEHSRVKLIVETVEELGTGLTFLRGCLQNNVPLSPTDWVTIQQGFEGLLREYKALLNIDVPDEAMALYRRVAHSVFGVVRALQKDLNRNISPSHIEYCSIEIQL